MIRSSHTVYSLITIQADPVSLGISQYLLVSIAAIAIFGIEVFATGFVAKKLGVFDVNYGRALWAALLKNGIFLLLAYVLNPYIPEAQLIPVLILVGTLAPITVYKFVFESTLVQAVLIWIVVLLVECVAGVALVYGALSVGASLDERFNLVIGHRSQLAGLTGLFVAPTTACQLQLESPPQPFHRRRQPDAY